MAKAKQGDAKADVISLLTTDHEHVKQLFEEFEQLKDQQDQNQRKAELVEMICLELNIHALVEEEIFYPAVRAAIEDDDLMDEAQAEHAGVKDLVSQLEMMTPDETQFNDIVTILSEQVAHHVSEEEGDMFPQAKKSKIDLFALGQEVAERKETLAADFGMTARNQFATKAGSARKPANP